MERLPGHIIYKYQILGRKEGGDWLLKRIQYHVKRVISELTGVYDRNAERGLQKTKYGKIH